MACETWTAKLDTYLDGELPEKEEPALREHLRICSVCASNALDRMRIKRFIQSAAPRFHPDPAFRARMQRGISTPHVALGSWRRLAGLALSAAALVFLAAALSTTYLRARAQEHQIVSELIDLHVATLASANPVDVVSTDRHTVKPWFEGKVPFTFDLPEFEGSPFSLVGGRTTYLNQSIGAQLIFRLRQHNLSVFIFQQRATGGTCSNAEEGELNFHLQSWSRNGLCYFAVGDVNRSDLAKLSALLTS